MISDSKLRHLLERYIQKGLDDNEVEELLGYCHMSKYTFLLGLITHLVGLTKSSHTKSCQCPSEWKSFVHCISSSSPVCALIPPNDKSEAIIDKICTKDITKHPEVCCIHSYMNTVKFYLYRI